jgi:hypothetical protein
VTSCLSAALLAFLVWRGLTGGHDPLTNPLPLAVWTVWWIGLVTVQGLLGNHWRWTNPFTGPAAALARMSGGRPPLRLPRALGHAPAIVLFMGFAGFLMADIAPADPHRLAVVAGLYWLAMLAGVVLFGPRWLVRGEALTVLMRSYARTAILGPVRGRLAAGLPGWKVARGRKVPASLALFILLMLGAGSFDGVNETFWWLVQIGINPLEFPGRSAVVAENLVGLLVANVALVAIFAVSLWLGERIAGTNRTVLQSVRVFAPSILPIALGYHIAHYLTSALVNGQYVLKALNDPLNSGADLLGLGTFHVTTGFLNTPGTVQAIWLTQAGAVVGGHVLAILVAHALAVRGHGSSWRATLGQAPLAGFMVAYTFFGLWLLASPRGV